jgi:aspartyl/asparaginyl-tRNA synthetase
LVVCSAVWWQYLLDNNMDEMEYFADPKWGVDPEALNRLKLVASSTFERCSYTKAIQILKDALAKVSVAFRSARPMHCCNLLMPALH